MVGSRASSPLPSPDMFSGDEFSGDQSSGDESSGDESYGNEVTADYKKRSGTLTNLDPLHCPVCVEPYTTLIFQCNNGHLACSSCCTKLSNKCLNCNLPIGKIRSITMENIVRSVIVSCPNSIFGCTNFLPYKDQKTHEKDCLWSQCSCPLLDCVYTVYYKNLYHHFDTVHKDYKGAYGPLYCGTSVDIKMHLSDKVYVLKAVEERLLFVVQCFSVSNGVCVDVSCVAPLGVKLDKFSYHLSMSSYSKRYEITFESKVLKKRSREVKFKTPEDNYMFVPKYLCVGDDPSLKMKLIIRKLKRKLIITKSEDEE